MNENSTTQVATSMNWLKHAVWVGLLLTGVGMFSYFLYLFQFPDLRDNSIANVALVLFGFLLCLVGSWKVFSSGSDKVIKAFTVLALLLTIGMTGLFNFYVFYFSYQLPQSAQSPKVESVAPDFTLLDQESKAVKLSDFRGKKVVITFYRGAW